MDQIDNQELKKRTFLCRTHKTKAKDIFISKNGIEFICFKCKQNYAKYPIQQILNLNEIIDQRQVIINLPPLTDKDFYINYYIDLDKEQNIEAYQEKIHQKQQEIEDFLVDMQKKINLKIDKLRQDTKENFSIIYQEYAKIQQVYDEISQKEVIKKILLNDKEEDLYQNLNHIIQEQFNDQQKNTNIIQNQINYFEKLLKSVSLKQPNQIFQTINELIGFIHPFKGVDIKRKQEENQIQLGKNNQSVFYELISNKTNYCNEIFLDQVTNFLREYKTLFNSIDFEENKYISKKREQFQDLSDEKLERLHVFSKIIDEAENQQRSILLNGIKETLKKNINLDLKNIFRESNEIERIYLSKIQQNNIFSKFSLKSINFLSLIEFYNIKDHKLDIKEKDEKIIIIKKQNDNVIEMVHTKNTIQSKYYHSIILSLQSMQPKFKTLCQLRQINQGYLDFIDGLSFNFKDLQRDFIYQKIKGEKVYNKIKVEIIISIEEGIFEVYNFSNDQLLFKSKVKINQPFEYKLFLTLQNIEDIITFKEFNLLL